MSGQQPEETGHVRPTDLESTAKLPVLDAATLATLDLDEDEHHLRTTVLPPEVFSDDGTHRGIPTLNASPELLADMEARVVVRPELVAAREFDPASLQDRLPFVAQVEQLQSQVDELNAELTRLGHVLVDRDVQLGELRQARAVLQGELERSRAQAGLREQQLESDLDAARRLGEDLDAMRREAEARSAAAEAEFAAERGRLDAELRERQERELAAQRTAHEQAVADARAAHLRELEALRRGFETKFAEQRQQGEAALAVAHAAAASQADELNIALRGTREEVATLTRELEALRALKAADETALSQARERIGLQEQELAAARAERAAAEREAAQVADGQAREIDLLRRELDGVRTLAATQVEALQAAESRRGIWASLVGDAEAAHAATLAEVQASAAVERERAQVVQAALESLQQRQGESEQALQSLRQQRQALETALDASRQRCESLEAEVETSRRSQTDAEAGLRAELEAAVGRASAAQTQTEALQAALAAAESSRESLRGELETAGSRLAGIEAESAAVREREQRLTADHAATATRAAELARELEALRASAAETETRLRAEFAERQQEHESLAARHAELAAELERATALAADAAAGPGDELRTLHAELRRGVERIAELESDLRAAEDQVHRLEGELRLKNARLDDLMNSSWEGSVLEGPPAARRRDEPAGRHRLDAGPAGEVIHAADSAFSGAASSADGITRYFVMMEGDTEIVHVLGRRTTIGRGLDNDVRIDTKFVSRHHAVVLVGPNQTVIEDLRSTNGVLVNGRRVTRAVLRDGDLIHVGKTQFRLVQRSRER
ncbi:MAG: FHA domain-containing protein [Steroidobacteraceae bacterium]|nr:FHA domain-containing protein [Nevskiaceae bacterium]